MQLDREHTMPRVHPASGPAPARAWTRRGAWRVALALGAGMLAGCGDNLPAKPPPDAPPEPGQEVAMAATFEVHGAGALVSIYARESSSARVRVENADGVLVADVGPVALPPARGRTGVAELAGLMPDTAYRYVVALERGSSLGPYHFRTTPAPDTAAEVHFVWSADIDIGPDFDSPIFATMSESGADFFASLGDWPYADNPPAARTIEEYRVKHLAVRGAGKVQALLRELPVYSIYDDHEARNNWDGRFRVEEAERIRNAVTVWDEWFPLRATLQGEARHWRSWRWGRHAEFFMLDTRCCRSADLDPDGPDKTMLGAEQKQWLIDALSASEATFKIVFSSVAILGEGTCSLPTSCRSAACASSWSARSPAAWGCSTRPVPRSLPSTAASTTARRASPAAWTACPSSRSCVAMPRACSAFARSFAPPTCCCYRPDPAARAARLTSSRWSRRSWRTCNRRRCAPSACRTRGRAARRSRAPRCCA
jgi:hypothetical protein